jgi:hypothetical protein
VSGLNKEKSFPLVGFPVLLRTFLLGVISAVILFPAMDFIGFYYRLSVSNEKWLLLLAISLSYLIILLCCLALNYIKVITVIKSYRFDLLVIFLSGVFLVYLFAGFYINAFNSLIAKMSWLQLTSLIAIPIIIFLAVTLRVILFHFTNKKEYRESSFMSDKEKKSKEEDGFNFADKAERFAKRVYNHGSPESLVFGIDAPWGTGKSTFINLCKEYWNENYNNKMVIYNFEPLRYENRDVDLLRIFIDGLVKEIKYQVFEPELEVLLSKYAKFIKSTKPSFSFLGLNFQVPFYGISIDDVFSRLEATLLSTNKKVVIIVDDLDRLSFTSIKEVLFVIKKAFSLPNISYVLCYDTENIAAFKQDALDREKIIEFLEKFINIKMNLYLEKDLLLKYFTESKDKALQKSPLIDSELADKAVDGIIDIFNSDDFHLYLSLVGDARKLKRLINTIILLDIDKTDFNNADFNKQDIIHLLLIYINYPDIFRKIYTTETEGRRGFFSAVTTFDKGFPSEKKDSLHKMMTYANSDSYNEYIKSLPEQPKFILNKIFNIDEKLMKDGVQGSFTQEMLATNACFNGTMWDSDGRNLEQYINLITNFAKPINTTQYNFYINIKKDILAKKSITETIKSAEEFAFIKSEQNHEQLWNVLINSEPGDYTPEKAKEIIIYAVENQPQYSCLKIGNIIVGFRESLSYKIVKLLNNIGWNDSVGKRNFNYDENVSEIAEWIFGEGQHDKGILEIMGKEERGIMGMYDLLRFRLYCCTDRGGTTHNITKALAKHGNINASTSGDVETILIAEMREISQHIFATFSARYIEKRKNIFEEIDSLTLKDLTGNYHNLVKGKIESGEIQDIDDAILNFKSKIKAFMVYQLGTTIISNGIGCGYYDTEGTENKNGINQAFSTYLIDLCFNPEYSEDNYKHFLDYLLINLVENTYSYEPQYQLSPDQFTTVLSKEMLKSFWEGHGERIKGLNYQNEDRTILIGRSSRKYNKDLDGVYNFLDALIEQNKIEAK